MLITNDMSILITSFLIDNDTFLIVSQFESLSEYNSHKMGALCELNNKSIFIGYNWAILLLWLV